MFRWLKLLALAIVSIVCAGGSAGASPAGSQSLAGARATSVVDVAVANVLHRAASERVTARRPRPHHLRSSDLLRPLIERDAAELIDDDDIDEETRSDVSDAPVAFKAARPEPKSRRPLHGESRIPALRFAIDKSRPRGPPTV